MRGRNLSPPRTKDTLFEIRFSPFAQLARYKAGPAGWGVGGGLWQNVFA